jgi:hypothetical protein
MLIVGISALVLTISAWLMFNMVVIARGSLRHCPKCAGRRILSTSRRWVDKLLPAFIAPRRCEVCRKRFHQLKSVNYLCRRPPARTSDGVRPPHRSHSA